MPLPDLLSIPRHFEEIIPVKIRYSGRAEEWERIVKVKGEKSIPAFVETEDGVIETCL